MAMLPQREIDREGAGMEITPLSPQDFELIEEAKATADRLRAAGAHEVAAALRTADGRIFCGIHIEAGVGFADVCGEVAAICHAVANGHRDVETIVAVWKGDDSYELMAPCGRCREVIRVFNPRAWVIVGTLDRPYKTTVADLLPLAPSE